MEINYYHIDAFTSSVFSGNPAGVCFLDDWPADDLLQALAAENNLSETAFLVRTGECSELLWFTPLKEVDLCGHATMASALAVFEISNPRASVVDFQTRSGLLSVECQNDLLVMDFPSRPPEPCPVPDNISEILGLAPSLVLKSRDLMAVYQEEEQVLKLRPDFQKIAALDQMAVIVTSPGKECDFVSRFFAPKVGIPEDPVTGSAHCTLIPYWSERLGKKEMKARQLSKRGGEIFCRDRGDRVSIGGRAVVYLSGKIRI